MKIILVDAIHTFVIKDEGIYEPLYNLLEQYSNKKIVLTNANDEQIQKYDLDKLPYELFTLKHNPDKVDPGYYKKMLERYNLKPDDVIYFEHSIEAIDSAKSLGIKTYYYDPDKKDLESLKSFIDENI